MIQMIKPYESIIVAINTDGFVSREHIDKLQIGKNLGQWKIEKEGECIVSHSNDIMFK
jgi:hypothetical protein